MNPQEKVLRDTNALVKFVLSQLEEVAGMPPELAAEPYELQRRRSVIVKKIWQTVRGALDAASVEVQ